MLAGRSGWFTFIDGDGYVMQLKNACTYEAYRGERRQIKQGSWRTRSFIPERPAPTMPIVRAWETMDAMGQDVDSEWEII